MMYRRRPGTACAGVLAAFLLLAVCSAGPFLVGCGASASGQQASGAGEERAVEIVVFASPTLTESFSVLARDFSVAHPEVTVTLNFVNAATAASQLKEGAPADVFASADMAQMEAVADLTTDPVVFAHNRLMIVVECGNPLGIRALADLARPDIALALGAPGRPIGEYAREVLTRLGIEVEPKSLEESARGVLVKVELGEVDAGIVMITDVAAAGGKVEGVPIADRDNALCTYPIAVLKETPHADAAQAFVDYVCSPEGQATLTSFGFVSPEEL